MTTEAPGSFSELVRQSKLDYVKQRTDEAKHRVDDDQKEYDSNFGSLKQLGLLDQLQETARSIEEITGRRAEMDISRRPYLDHFDDLSPKIPVVKGSSECEVTLKWEPSGTEGIENSIEVRVVKGELVISSGKLGDREGQTNERFPIQEIDMNKVNTALFEAYQHPHW